jgi:hypothetical protein
MTASAPDWLDELQSAPGPPWHAMGTRALAASGWLLPDPEQVARKRELLRTVPEVVSGRIDAPGVEAAASEAAALVSGGATESLGEAALGVAEDLCVLVPDGGRWTLAAGVVCFPSMWRLPDKLGLPLASVHGPVPAYADELASRVDRFLDRLSPDRPVWRRNWLVHECEELHLPEPPPPPSHPVEVPDGLSLRSERQTLRRLPASGGVLFTIRTQQVPLAVVAGRPEVAGRLAGAIDAWSDDLVAYRSAGRWRAAAVRWLRSVGGAPGSDR